MAIEFEKPQYSTDEYHLMVQAGILHEDDRVELIDGEIVIMSPVGGAHIYAVNLLNHALICEAAQFAIVSVQNPIHLGPRSEPQPDFTLLKRPITKKVPEPADIMLVAEVSDTTKEYDQTVKRLMYASAGIPAYWLFDLGANAVEVYTQPESGDYTQKGIARLGNILTLDSIPTMRLPVDEILTP